MARRYLFQISCTLVLSFAAACSANTKGAAEPQSPLASEHLDTAPRLFERGRQAAAAGDTVRAEQYLSLAIQEGYDARRALQLLLTVCLQGSRLRAALDHAAIYMLAHPQDESVRYLVATLHLILDQPDEARLDLETLLRSNPKNADAHFLMGVLLLTTAPQRAAEHLHQYLDLSPEGDHAPEVRSRLQELTIRADPTSIALESLRPTQSATETYPALEDRSAAPSIESEGVWFGRAGREPMTNANFEIRAR